MDHHQAMDGVLVVSSHRIALVSSSADLEMAEIRDHFFLDSIAEYHSFCDDFGPMNLACVFRFCEMLHEKISQHKEGFVGVVYAGDQRSFTNSVFLIGCFLIMKCGMDVKSVVDKLRNLETRLASYRDVSPGTQNFSLYVQDCWGGLELAKCLGWVSFETGAFNLMDYEECDNPLNADLHELIPNKFVAMKGPRDLPAGRLFQDIPSGARIFSPAHYAEILGQFDVQAVIRLNESEYDPASFECAGIAVADLTFDDCTTPPVDVVAKFLAIAEGIPGALAVHCKSGLGRTGTLVAMYMIKHHGFTARQAMGWLRIVRPGSVIGPQQAFLCESEGALRRAGDSFRRRGGPGVAVDSDAPASAVAAFIAAAVAATDARIASSREALEKSLATGAGAGDGVPLSFSGSYSAENADRPPSPAAAAGVVAEASSCQCGCGCDGRGGGERRRSSSAPDAPTTPLAEEVAKSADLRGRRRMQACSSWVEGDAAGATGAGAGRGGSPSSGEDSAGAVDGFGSAARPRYLQGGGTGGAL